MHINLYGAQRRSCDTNWTRVEPGHTEGKPRTNAIIETRKNCNRLLEYEPFDKL